MPTMLSERVYRGKRWFLAFHPQAFTWRPRLQEEPPSVWWLWFEITRMGRAALGEET